MKVYLNEYIHPKAEALLKSKAEVCSSLEDLPKVDAIILRNIPVTAEMMDKAPNLKVIGKHGVGVNTIDLNAAKERGITVLNTPTTNADSVAEMIVALILSAARKIPRADRGCRNSEYSSIAPRQLTGVEISGKVFGQIGMGNIGTRAARMLRNGFGMKTIGYDIFMSEETARSRGFEKVDTIEELVSRSDVINVNVGLTESTVDLISGKLFDIMKPGAILINTARGAIVNEDDLYDALSAGKLFAAACDVFVKEPANAATKLLELDNFIATPHLGGSTQESLERTGMEVVEEVLSVLAGNEPKHRIV